MARHFNLICPIDSARRKPRYSSPLSEKRGVLRTILTTKLRELTKEPRARTRYNVHVVRKYGCRLAGWPTCIPTSLSNLRGGRGPIDELLHLWNTGVLTFIRVNLLDEALALRPRTDRKCASRCDLGTHRKARTCCHRDAITPLVVLAEVDARVDAEAIAEAAEFERKHGRPLAKGELASDPIEQFDE
ncbi:hypothetical protein FOMPIDRAFT_1055432 [Fomitopsis schrenkii]|uniref:Uncharacterized protein n=1 Tax=Fomitopsis schrenkii TaxID=2126942 RepID=S8F529_FOMSC|nr:hypothetical protein FOMPIDRAFT_1055432 [Fomitopsis schrenkii]